ncbi:hypothetical protein BDN70DRAFT_56073 [Pholiota conissans]|uniref:Extracellular serine-rich protein n=1 Tax=Pholiota conissans TaxID=109636 RepID=A0A9P6D6D2_9AGAR|nr:hypothetical protein BDN70DRAFT_56073 [Pholiota conissans]
MFFLTSYLALAIAHYLLLFCNGQTTHTVTVGQLGSFYDPPQLLTGVNDTVTFIFAGDNHTVTQSSFDNPCSPLAGGFDSGIVINSNSNSSNAPSPMWTIRITNSSEPIYFHCETGDHCKDGMVGVINPPNNQAFMQFQSSAMIATPSVRICGSK